MQKTRGAWVKNRTRIMHCHPEETVASVGNFSIPAWKWYAGLIKRSLSITVQPRSPTSVSNSLLNTLILTHLHRMCCRDEPTPRILRAFISDERTELREIIIYTASLSSSRVVGRWCIASNTAYRLSTTCENASQARAHDIVRRASPVRRERAYSGIHRSWICLLQCPCLLLPMTRAVEVADLEPISSTVVIDIAV